MAFSHGKDSVFKVDNSGGSLTDISAYVTDVSMPMSASTHDVTTMGKSYNVRIGGLKDGQFRVSGKYDPTVDSLMFGILGSVGSYEYGPAGSGTGSPKYTGEAVLESYEASASVSSEATWTATFSISDTITRGTY